MKPISPDDVPATSRWRCTVCGSLSLPTTQPVEHLLGGWVKAHCHICRVTTIQTPVKEEPHGDRATDTTQP